MEPGILVRSTPTRWWMTALRAIGILTLAVGGLGWAQGEDWSTPVLIVGAIVLGLAETAFLVKAMRRRWVRDTGKGFAVTDRAGRREFADEQVRSMSLSVHTVYSEGVASGTARRFTVWVDPGGAPETIAMTGRFGLNEDDPLKPLIERIAAKLLDRARIELDGGRPVVGPGWTLEKTRLNYGVGADATALPLDGITDVDIFDNHVCVWRTGAAEPVLRVPVDSPDAYLLQTLLRERIPPRKSDAPPADGLGRILFERRPSRVLIGVFLWGGLAAVLIGIGFLAAGARSVSPSERESFFEIGGLTAGIAAPCALLAWAFTSAFFRCHEYGVCRRAWTFSGEKQLAYVDVAGFTYQAVRHYHNGVYTGTQLSMTFRPFAGSGKPKVSYSTSIRSGDEELNNLRTHISQVIAARMAQEFAQAGSVQWTPTLRILKEGLEYRPSGFFSTKPAVLLRFEDLRTVDLEAGYFYIWSRHQDKYVHSEDCSAENFFPGLTLFTELMSPDEPAPEGSGAEAPGETTPDASGPAAGGA
jgi:hypothetical protein